MCCISLSSPFPIDDTLQQRGPPDANIVAYLEGGEQVVVDHSSYLTWGKAEHLGDALVAYDYLQFRHSMLSLSPVGLS